MKKHTQLTMISALMAITPVLQAAEIYNKDGNKLDFYGRVKAEHYLSDNQAVDGDQSYVRFGFKGITQINDKLQGFGQWEYQIAANHAESEGATGTKTRLGFAGLRYDKLGSIDYGRNYGVLYDVEAWTDMIPEFGADSYTRADNFMTGRTTGVATYRNRDFFGLVDGLNFSLQYQGKNEGDRDYSKQNGDGYGMAMTYNLGAGISVGGAYAASDRTAMQQSLAYGRGDKAEGWTTGLKYDDNNVYLAAMYAETRNMTPISGKAVINGVSTGVKGMANKTQNVELVAQYQFDSGLRPSLGYIQSKGKDIEGVGDADLVKYIDVATTYYFNKNMSVFAEYKINQLDDNNKLHLNSDDVVALGLVYQF